MYYNHQLKANIQEWRNRFLKSDFDYCINSFNFLYDKLNNQAVIKAIFIELESEYQYSQADIQQIINKRIETHVFDNEKQHAAFNYQMCKFVFETKKDFRYWFVVGKNFRDTVEYFKDSIVSPLTNFIQDKLDGVSNVLYSIEKYKLRTEWFTKQDLTDKYNNENKRYEGLLEDDLRLFLFDQGIDYPFSTPKSASGRADIISLIYTDDPLVMEIKIYDSKKGYKKDRIINGFAQIVKYAEDYHKDTGYLVVFNMDNIEIEIQGHESDNKWPNRFVFNGKTYYIIFINLNNEISASKQGKLKRETISFEELTKDVKE